MSKSPSNHQWPDDDQQLTSSQTAALCGFAFLLPVVICLICHLYSCCCNRCDEIRRRNRHSRSTGIVLDVDNNTVSPSASGGLDSNVLKSLPVFLYSSENRTHTPECAVCISEFEDGESGRVLPKCKHSFHTQCIDMWFYSKSTCPLCRLAVEPVIELEATSLLAEPGSSESLNEMTSVRIDE